MPTLHTVGLLAPGSMLPSAFPGPKTQWHNARFTPRSQWRDRVGIAPTSRIRDRVHRTRPAAPPPPSAARCPLGEVTDAAESLVEEALRLPAADRAQLASGLLASLDTEPVDEAAVDEAWGEETERRARMLVDGSAEPVTWEHLVERIDARRSPSAGG